jgi:hypothetical protein
MLDDAALRRSAQRRLLTPHLCLDACRISLGLSQQRLASAAVQRQALGCGRQSALTKKMQRGLPAMVEANRTGTSLLSPKVAVNQFMRSSASLVAEQSDGEQPRRPDRVKDENCERVDPHTQQPPLRPEDQARKVDARQ